MHAHLTIAHATLARLLFLWANALGLLETLSGSDRIDRIARYEAMASMQATEPRIQVTKEPQAEDRSWISLPSGSVGSGLVE